MSTVKRKLPNSGLQRRVRPRFEAEPESDVDEVSSEGAPSEEDVGSYASDSQEEDSDENGSEDEGGDRFDNSVSSQNHTLSCKVSHLTNPQDSEADSDEEGDTSNIDPSQLSFGALARASVTLSSSSSSKKKDPSNPRAGAVNPEEYETASTSKKPCSSSSGKHKRSRKHAPVEISSKKRVSRRRDFIDVPKVQARDPRFLPLSKATPIDEIKARKAYAFLNDYQKDEMNQLRGAIKKTKDPIAKEKLQKALTSMESRQKAQERKDRERALLEEHRKKEKELIKQGKTPYYLKKSEQKKQLLVQQFAGMKKSQVDHAIERRRKKVASKEKKHLPLARRTAEDR